MNYQFKLMLAGSKPVIWRRVLVLSSFTLEELHVVIQMCFGWEFAHLFAFELCGRIFDDEAPQVL